MKTYIKNITLLFTALILLSSCEATKNANNKQKGAVLGAAGGAILGAVIGNNVGNGNNSEIGAVLGGVVGGTAGVIIGNKMDKQAQKIEEEIPGAVVERIDDSIVITFDENSGVYFDTSKFDINAASQSTLDKLAAVMLEYNQTNAVVTGHTDSSGAAEYNMTLSKNRATSVTQYLINKGIAANRMTTLWHGEDQPTASNDTAEGRSKNRRVTLGIVPNEEMKQEAIEKSKQ